MSQWVATLFYIASHNLKEGRILEYQRWLKRNSKKLAEHAPPGWRYVGTYMTVLGFGTHDKTTVYEVGKYADFDNLRNHDDAAWARLTAEEAGFHVHGSGQAMLMRAADDTFILEPDARRRRSGEK